MTFDLENDQAHADVPFRTVLSLWRGVMEVGPPVWRSPTVVEIQTAVADHYRVTKLDLLSERRARAIARPRQVAMWLCKRLTTRSLPDIGRRFGGRDHTTVLHAVRRIEALRLEDPAIDDACEALVAKLGGYPR